MKPRSTVFGDLRQPASGVYRVITQGSVYTVAFHEQDAKRYVVVRSEMTGREPVLLRDSDPKIGPRSLFDTPPLEWIGQCLQVATMTSSPVLSVVPETEGSALADVGTPLALAPLANQKENRSPWARPDAQASSGSIVLPPASAAAIPLPPGMSEAPRIVPQQARGTLPADAAAMALGKQALPFTPIDRSLSYEPPRRPTPPAPVAATPQPAPQPADLPYPDRHVHYAESIVQLLRSISRRDKIFEDMSGTPLRARMRTALDECAVLLELIRRRDR